MLFEAVPAQRAAILLFTGQPPQPVVRASRSRQGVPIREVPRSIARHVLRERASLILPNLLEDDAFRGQQSILASGIRSALAAPLWLASADEEDPGIIGLVYLDSIQRTHSFTEDDLAVVTALANLAAAKIENARLLDEALEKRRLEEDMRVAAEIQRKLLPSESPTLAGWDVAGSTRPCRAVGGDYFDFGPQVDGVLLALGDVSGKGTGAALLMTMLRVAVRAHWCEGDPAEVVGRINRTVCQNIPDGKFITFFLGRLQAASGQLSFVNAGHNPPLLVRADGRCETLHDGGMVLGLFDAVVYEEGTVVLAPGDLLVVFSDGVTETWNEAGDEFGEEGLVAAVTAARHLTAAGVEAAVLEAIEAYAAGVKATDDRTIIVLKRCPL